MSYTYEVQKSKRSRVTYRVVGIFFLIVAILQFIPLIAGSVKHPYITAVFMVMLGMYGAYLLISSFRKTAFDIIYRFDDNGMKVTHKYGVTQYSFDDIEFITMVIADEMQMFYILNIKTKKDVYTIPFTLKKDYCEKIYEFVNTRIKHDDAD